jgi:aerobic-type carbon monoxide dehydrogenase small subunit (CoxS/CutS family)
MELIEFELNGRSEAVAANPDEPLLDLLRRQFKLFSVRESCGIGICGTCTVRVDGKMVSSCLMLAAQAVGRSIETVEGLSDDGNLHPIQQAFVEHNAFQCSYCTPGFLLAAQELLEQNPDASPDEIREFLAGNICRCGSYLKIVEAVTDAGARMNGMPEMTS